MIVLIGVPMSLMMGVVWVWGMVEGLLNAGMFDYSSAANFHNVVGIRMWIAELGEVC